MRKLPKIDMSRDTYYIVLGVPETATQDEIKRAYRRLIKQVHPDKFSNASPNRKLATETRSRAVIEAYYVLSDSAQRSFYDQQLVGYRQQHTPTLPRPQPRTASTPPSRTSRKNPRSWRRADQKGANWEFLRRVLQLALYCVSFLIVAVIFVSLFIDILVSLFELLQPS